MSRLSLIIIDEAHHTPSATYKRIIEAYQHEDTRLLGVTATPIRLDGKGFDSIFDKLIPSRSFKWFIAGNYLSPIKHYASASVRLSHIPVVRDNFGYEDYDLTEVENYYTSGEVMADVLKSYMDYGQNKKSIVFAVSIKHALEVEKRFIAAGYIASVISSLTSEAEREERIEDFKKGRIRILVNVDIFCEGFDCPDVEVVQMLKPTKSLVKYLQMAGRVTRTFPRKEYGIILDNARLWADHGLVTQERRWSLEGCMALDRNFEELNFTNGESGQEAYKKHINEHVDVGMVEVDSTGTTPDIVFLNKRLVNVKNEFKVTWNELFDYFESIDLDLIKHCQGPSNSIYQRKVSQELYDLVDRKFCSHKSFYKMLRSSE